MRKNILFRINKCMTRISFKFNIKPPTMGKKRSSKSTIHYYWRVTRNRRFTVSLHTYTSTHTLTWNYVKCRSWASDHPSRALFLSSARSRLLQPYFSLIFIPRSLSLFRYPTISIFLCFSIAPFSKLLS